MEGNHQQMIVNPQLHELRPEHRSPRQVQWPLYFVSGQAVGGILAMVSRKVAHVLKSQRDLQRRLDHLNWLIRGKMVGCPEHFMTAHDFVHSTLQHVRIEPSTEPQHFRGVVGWTIWCELVEQPLTLLGKRERKLSFVCPATDGGFAF